MPEQTTLVPQADSRDERLVLAAAKEASRETMAELFSLLGVNTANFDSMQQLRDDLTFIRNLRSMKEFNDDLRFVGSLRSVARKAGMRFMLTLVALLAAALGAAAWSWFQTAVMHRP